MKLSNGGQSLDNSAKDAQNTSLTKQRIKMKGRISSGGVQQGSTLPEIGRIKVGEKSAKGFPTSLDYFRATGNFANKFSQLMGEKPNELHIAFVSNDIAEVCNEQFEAWDKGKRFGWGDGVTFTVWDAASSSYVEGVNKDDPRVKAIKGWSRTLTLRFVLLKMTGVYGYWTFQTKAKETTIPSIVKAFDMVMDRSGSIVGFPFSLVVEKVKSYSPGEARNYPIVKLIPNFTEETIEQVRAYVEAGGELNRLTTNMITSGAILNGGVKQLGVASEASEEVFTEVEEVK